MLAAAAFTGLGVWQVQRRGWKLELIAAVEARVHAAPVPAPGPAAWPGLTGQDAGYRHVRVHGTWLPGPATPVQALTDRGTGWWLLAPLRTAEGWTVLVNRGFVPSRTDAPVAAGPATVTGLLRTTEPGGWLRRNDPASDAWMTRDVAAIARARGLQAAPYFIDADATANPGGLPVGGLTVVAFTNHHLIYALTWFTLTGVCIGGLVLVYRR